MEQQTSLFAIEYKHEGQQTVYRMAIDIMHAVREFLKQYPDITITAVTLVEPEAKITIPSEVMKRLLTQIDR